MRKKLNKMFILGKIFRLEVKNHLPKMKIYHLHKYWSLIFICSNIKNVTGQVFRAGNARFQEFNEIMQIRKTLIFF